MSDDQCEGCQESCNPDPEMFKKLVQGRALIRSAVEEAVRLLTEENRMCTGWFLAAEFQDMDGRCALCVYSGDTVDRSLPPWRIEGLVTYALEE